MSKSWRIVLANRALNRMCAAVGVLVAGVLPWGGCSLADFIPTEAELQAYQQQLEEFQGTIDALPSMQVRIVNNSQGIARVTVDSFLQGPSDSLISPELAFSGDTAYLTSIDYQVVYVTPGGTAEGTIKCGEAITISADAPYDLGGIGSLDETYGFDSSELPAIYADGGNLQFAGIGRGGQEFMGDVVDTVRIIQPEIDAVDCAGDVLIVEIITPAVFACPGEPTEGCIETLTTGSAEVRIEPAPAADTE